MPYGFMQRLQSHCLNLTRFLFVCQVPRGSSEVLVGTARASSTSATCPGRLALTSRGEFVQGFQLFVIPSSRPPWPTSYYLLAGPRLVEVPESGALMPLAA